MTNSHLQKMVHMIRNELHTRKIPILCETYDGQWHKHVTENAQSHCLTQLFGRDNWNRVASLTKDKCIEQVSTMCVVKNSTHSVLMEKEITGEEELIVGNFKMEKGSRNELHVSTKEGRMRYVHSVHPLSRPDLYSKTQVDLSYNNDNKYLVCENKYECEATGEKVKKLRKYKFTSVFTSAETYEQPQKLRKKKPIGFAENEKSLLDILQPNRAECEEDLDNINIDDITNTQQNNNVETYLKTAECPLLENILNQLQRKNPQKWETVTLDELFSEYLICRQMLMKETNLKEIGIILLELRCITGRIWHTNDMLKAEKVNAIVTAFGGTNFAEVKRCGKKIHNPDSLLLSCTNVIKGNDFPVEHIQIPLASLLQIEERRKWCENATVPLTCRVPGGHIKFFSYPELNTLRAQLEFRTFDFTHILTNLRTQILTRGLDYCKNSPVTG